MSPVDAAISHARTVISAFVLILAAGAIAYVAIPKESNPDISIPIVYVSVHHDGISPEDSERLLIRPLETQLRSIEGLKEMRSKGYEGGANVVLEFDAGFDADEAMDDVREKVDLANPEMPAESDEPEVHEVNFSLFPVIVVTLSGVAPERALVRMAREMRDEIEGIPSVLEANIAGDREELVEVLVDSVTVEGYGLSPRSASNAVSGYNLLVAAGAQDTGQGKFSVKVPGLFETVKDIMNMPLATHGDAVIRLGDVGEVRRAFKDQDSAARINGERAVAIEVVKRSGENVIETIERVREVVAAEQALWPEALRDVVRVDFLQDESVKIRNMLKDLQNNVLSAVLLVMIVVVGALGLRTAGLVGVAIPGSFLAAILVLYALDVSVNIVVLFSLILAVGMLVDGAIVVTEYADRKMSEGEPPRKAYSLAARRMAWPITASTATTLAAFLPLVFWPGTVGEFMKYLPMTLLITLTASLMMALIFVPTLGAVFGKAGGAVSAEAAGAVAEDGSAEDLMRIGGFTGKYLKVLGTALLHPGKILLLSVAVLIGVQVYYATHGNGVEFFPDVEPERAVIDVRARGNLSFAESDILMSEVENRILTVEGFDSIYSRVGSGGRSEKAEDIIGSIQLEFSDWRERRKAKVILEEVDERLADLAGIVIDVRPEKAGPQGGEKAVHLEVTSLYPNKLPLAVIGVLEGMEDVGGFTNIEDSRPLPGIDWQIKVDRAQAAKFSVNIDLIGRAIQMTTTGIKLGGYRPDDSDDEIDIRARYPKKDRTVNQLDQIRIHTGAGAVPISNFVTKSAKPKTGNISRVDSRRTMTIKADVEEGVLVDEKVGEMKAWLAEAAIDPGVNIAFRGQDEKQKEAGVFLIKAFAVALFVMAIILVTQFNSFYSAFLILSAVIMSTIGVMIGLIVTGQPFGTVMGGIGVISLAGIVVNNNIVLIDTFDRLLETTKDARLAIMRTGAQRLRPVLLTTVTTILGLMPMVLSMNVDLFARVIDIGAPSTQWWRQLSTSIVFGLGFATVLTLVVTPCALMARANIGASFRRRWPRNAGQPGAQGPGDQPPGAGPEPEPGLNR
ncbi:MAG: efflux RND transporter permease subunit [Rhodospirillales bacterium]